MRVDNSHRLIANTTMLAIGIHLYLPVFEASAPVVMAMPINPTTMGNIINPEPVAFTPVTICK